MKRIKQFFLCLFGKHVEGERKLTPYSDRGIARIGLFSVCKHCNHRTLLPDEMCRQAIWERMLGKMNEAIGKKK